LRGSVSRCLRPMRKVRIERGRGELRYVNLERKKKIAPERENRAQVVAADET